MNSHHMNSAHHHFSNDDSSKGILVYINPVPRPNFFLFPTISSTQSKKYPQPIAVNSIQIYIVPVYSVSLDIYSYHVLPSCHALYFSLIIFCWTFNEIFSFIALLCNSSVLLMIHLLAERECQEEVNSCFLRTSLKTRISL